MKGIKVIYKPILALKPTHIAVVCVLEQPCQSNELSGRLPLPEIVLEHVVEELSCWQLVARNGEGLGLTADGKFALTALKATQKNGFWDCADDGTWILGEGKFQLPETLTDLGSAGWNSETGEILNEATALNAIKERQAALAASDAYVSSGKCGDEITAALQKGRSFDEAVESMMDRAFSVIHLNRMSDQLVASLANSKSRKENHSESLKVISSQKKARLRRIQRLQRDGQRAVWVIFARWLRQRDGILGELVRQHPSAFRCVSTIGVPLWEDEKEPETPTFSRFEPQQSDAVNSNGGFLSWIGDMVSSILR